MARFIELHNNGRAVLINLDSVQLINVRKDGAVNIFFIGEDDDSWLEVDESYRAVKEIVKGANNETTDL